MYSIALFAEGGGEGGIGWMVWVALVIFFVMVFLGWWVASKGWLKKEEEPVHDAHEEHGHEHTAQEAEHTHAEAVSFSLKPAPVEAPSSAPDDLTTLEGIGPKVAKLLEGIGITTFAQLAEADLAKLRETLDGAGYTYMEPAGWVEQAALAAKGDAEGLQKLQDSLKGGRKVE
jgi:predicted flap endonuclease-1-like 5' DNA nuclease